MSQQESVLVISAHAADFVWRAGGAVALAASRGDRVRVLCLTYGERGESASAWRAGQTLAEIKALRRGEAESAAAALGAEIEFLDAGDYPLRESDELVDRIVRVYREVNPSVVLTHPLADPYNGDHPAAGQMALRARVLAQAIGYPAPGEPIGAPPVFLFEPHQPEMCGFKPEVLLDITPVFDTKRKAMECMGAQQHLWEYYTDLAKRRGTQLKRNAGPNLGLPQSTLGTDGMFGELLATSLAARGVRGLVREAPVRIHMVNSGSLATAMFPEADGMVDYDGHTAIAGVPGTAAAVVLGFAGTEGSATGALLPTGHVTDVIDGITVTCIDNGMPVVVVAAPELGRTGYETVAELEADTGLGQQVRALRLAAGQLMGLGDVSAATVPKVSLLAAPADGGTICTRTFIPVRVHDSIGVLGAVSVATALLLQGAAGSDLAAVKPGQTRFDIEHPTGHVEVEVEVDQTRQPPTVIRSGVVRPRGSSSTALSSPGGSRDEPAGPLWGGGHPAAAARGRPPRAHRAAHAGAGGEPAVLRGHPRPDRDRPRGQLGLPAHVGRLRAAHPQADRARHLGHPPGGAAGLEPGRPGGPGGAQRQRRLQRHQARRRRVQRGAASGSHPAVRPGQRGRATTS